MKYIKIGRLQINVYALYTARVISILATLYCTTVAILICLFMHYNTNTIKTYKEIIAYTRKIYEIQGEDTAESKTAMEYMNKAEKVLEKYTPEIENTNFYNIKDCYKGLKSAEVSSKELDKLHQQMQ